jgi:hypothetical protein
VTVCVECRDHKRVADVSWVDAMKAKHERLPTNALILASRSGFTLEARDAAAGYRIQVFSLADVETAAFPNLLESKSTLWAKTVTFSVEKVVLKVLRTGTLADESVVVSADNLVYSSDGQELCQLGALVKAMLNSPQARDRLLLGGTKEHVSFDVTWESPRDQLERPLYIKKLEPETVREIRSIYVKGPCKFEIEKFGMRGGKLGDIQLAWGKTSILGRDALVVATKDATGNEELSVNVLKERA